MILLLAFGSGKACAQSLDSTGKFILKKEIEYDLNNNKTVERIFNDITYTRIWINEYDSLNRPLSFHRIDDTSNGYEYPWMEKIEFKYEENHREKTKTKSTFKYRAIESSLEFSSVETVVTHYNGADLWLSSTYTTNGVITSYVYPVYEFR